MESDGYQQNLVESLRAELQSIVGEKLSPIAQEYSYSDIPLENAIKWKPIVLILGNYSSGKSTLVNELLDRKVQDTGQAPTDDSFTVLTYGDSDQVEQRDGRVLLNEDVFPFERLRKFGDRFTSHFRLKKVPAPILKNLAIIDTPGMLDSMAERDRGYDYQKVIGELAQLADLTLVLFDPHKAGTVRESHMSLRETLPKATSEDRVIFVLNRIDECSSLSDLLRVYGTLTWNLSQMTGRKDIPKILLTCSNEVIENHQDSPHSYLHLLKNQRNELAKVVESTPTYRLDHLVGYVESHVDKMEKLLTCFESFAKNSRNLSVRSGLFSFFIIAVVCAGLALYQTYVPFVESLSSDVAIAVGALVCFLTLYAGWQVVFWKVVLPFYQKRWIGSIGELVDTSSQLDQDIWQSVKQVALDVLKTKPKLARLSKVRKQLASLRVIRQRVTKEVRQAIEEVHSN